ncbi:hypothetical protein E2N92_00225 [Methanofollis formosanus]|uniref:Uncharacterized protein n=1 Tax=Methanofollis formosanus TaxID=299308 RepID=A0A8G0ZY26_9EURY|nr:hypothetical protein [Methanofollis formosanus]QYZ77961.1 hypothetical protein E2N92_00225 [Methanofollis formosanus]
MKTPGKRTSTLLIAIVLPLAFMAYWLVRMFNISIGPEAIAGAVFIAGVFVAVGLGAVALKKGAKVHWVAVSFVVGAVLCVLIFLGISLSLAWHESVPPLVSYHVSVVGLDGRTGDGSTTILVPLPMKDGEVVIPSSELADRTFDNWTTTMVGTKDGTMLAFQHRQKNLTDIDARFYLYEKDISGTERLPEEYLSPVLEKITDEEYTTVIYVDEGVRPPGDLTVNLELSAGGGLFHGMFEDMYQTEVQESVPAGTAGRIVVTAEVEEYRPSGP